MYPVCFAHDSAPTLSHTKPPPCCFPLNIVGPCGTPWRCSGLIESVEYIRNPFSRKHFLTQIFK